MDAGCCSGAHPRLGAPFPIEKDDLSGEGGSILTARSRRSVLGVRGNTARVTPRWAEGTAENERFRSGRLQRPTTSDGHLLLLPLPRESHTGKSFHWSNFCNTK
ncbi:unnamed protein product [Nesidiocoris tenuis]|uniref:Uncharacterized protein n=1 Tax=Nesidiocoris tenuis TaxID=355587 RepID=A0A6H5GR36_9HEMI|nr:unnamed protein product [Nesidiocoris tenuis]